MAKTRAKLPTLADALDRWPIFEMTAFQDQGKPEIDRMLRWAIGPDWRGLRLDYVPERLMRRLGIAVSWDDDPLDTFRTIRMEWTRKQMDEAVERMKRLPVM